MPQCGVDPHESMYAIPTHVGLTIEEVNSKLTIGRCHGYLYDSIKLILDVFWEKGIQKDYQLSLFDLFYKSFQWHQNHQDNFLKALSLLIDEGIINLNVA